MSDPLLAESEARQLALLSTILTDAETKKRIAAIQDAQAAYDLSLKKLQQQQQLNEQAIREAQDKLSEAATMAANAEAKRREAEAHETRVGEVQAALDTEKRSFEGVRQQVDANQGAYAAALVARDIALADLEKEAAALMARNTERSADLDALQKRLDTAVAKLKAAMQGL